MGMGRIDWNWGAVRPTPKACVRIASRCAGADMTNIVAAVTVALLLTPALRSSDAAEPKDAAAVRSTLEPFNAAIGESSVEALRNCTTAAFHLIEDGIDHDRQKTEEWLLEAAREGRISRNISNIRLEFGEATAFDRIETVVLARGSGGWRVSLATSMVRSK
jgi:hypothetical protein